MLQSDLKQKPTDFGFAVSRTYESVENIDDVRKDSDGNWHIKAGSLVRSKVQFSALWSAISRRSHRPNSRRDRAR